MKKVCLIAFLCCILVSYATEPLDIFRVKSIAFHYDNKWSPEGEYKGVIMLFDDRIVNKSDTGLGEFRIVGEVELTKNPFGNSASLGGGYRSLGSYRKKNAYYKYHFSPYPPWAERQ